MTVRSAKTTDRWRILCGQPPVSLADGASLGRRVGGIESGCNVRLPALSGVRGDASQTVGLPNLGACVPARDRLPPLQVRSMRMAGVVSRGRLRAAARRVSPSHGLALLT